MIFPTCCIYPLMILPYVRTENECQKERCNRLKKTKIAMGGTIEQDDVESSVIKRKVVFHHQIICDHFQRFSESLKNIKR